MRRLPGLAVILGAATALLFLFRNAFAGTPAGFKVHFTGGSIPFEPVFDDVARKRAVSKRLLLAHTFVESKFDPRALNEESAADRRLGRDVDSIGLMQILFPDTAQGIRLGVTRDQLFEPTTNIDIGAMVILDNLRRYPAHDAIGFPAEAVAAYNAGSARRKADGSFVNQAYVTSVREAFIGYAES